MTGEFGPTLSKGIKALDYRSFCKSESTVRAALCVESANFTFLSHHGLFGLIRATHIKQLNRL
jgi:hypothetical protein